MSFRSQTAHCSLLKWLTLQHGTGKFDKRNLRTVCQGPLTVLRVAPLRCLWKYWCVPQVPHLNVNMDVCHKYRIWMSIWVCATSTAPECQYWCVPQVPHLNVNMDVCHKYRTWMSIWMCARSTAPECQYGCVPQVPQLNVNMGVCHKYCDWMSIWMCATSTATECQCGCVPQVLQPNVNNHTFCSNYDGDRYHNRRYHQERNLTLFL
jgi:hypothetical protein